MLFWVILLASLQRCFLEGAAKEVTEADILTNDGDLFPVPSNGRLPLWVSPSHYEIFLSVFLSNATYDGVVKIKITVHNETDKIILNMVDILTKNESTKVYHLTLEEENEMQIKNQSYDPVQQFYIIHLGQRMKAGGVYRLQVSFKGSLNSKLVGFYLSSYADENGKEILVANTQFSPLDARRAFPCFDEPSFKATFGISIERESDKFTLSNMPLLNTSVITGDENRFLDRFETTPKMSTYLVGFLVSDFSYKSSDIVNGTEFKVWSRKEALNQVNYSLEVGPKILTFLEDYFGVPYPLPKLDMAAVPDFKFNGMENWGLIMYRESALLFDPLLSTIKSKRNVIRVVAHEIAHMWFGNLVTPKWWSELWLKEGFANFMGYMAVDNVEPSWKMMDYLVESSYFDAFDLDSLLSSHPINVEVSRPDRISEIFDAISYNKGASIIRMMFHFLTEQVYKQGMQNYVKNLQYENAVQEDLWYYLTEAWKNTENFNPERTVEAIMNSWTLQEGFPVVHVQRNGSDIYLSQERFLMEEDNETENDTKTSNGKWWIPVSIVREASPDFSNTEPEIWMSPYNDTLVIKELSPNERWFVLNAQKTGYFRINYDPTSWNLLSQQLRSNFSVIHHLNRVQILDDAFNLARIGYVNYSNPLQMGMYMKNERDLTAWNSFAYNYKYIYNMAKSSSNITLFNKYILDLIIPIYNLTEFQNLVDESYTLQGLQILATYWACSAGYKPCLTKSENLFKKWLELPSNESSQFIASNVKPIVLCSGIKNASSDIWNATFQVYLNSNSQAEKIEILKALGCTEDPVLSSRLLDMSLDSSSGIKKQDVYYVFEGLSSTNTGKYQAWETIKQKWRFILNYFGSGSNTLWKIIEAPTKYFNTHDLVTQFQEFKETNEQFLGSARQTVDRYLEGAKINTKWMQQRFTQIENWLSENLRE